MNPESERPHEEEPEYVPIGKLADRLNMQNQYLSFYLGGYGGQPDLSDGIRFYGRVGDPHSISFHPDDVDEFVRRVQEDLKRYHA